MPTKCTLEYHVCQTWASSQPSYSSSVPSHFIIRSGIYRSFVGPWAYESLALVYRADLLQPQLDLNLFDLYPPPIVAAVLLIWAWRKFLRGRRQEMGMVLISMDTSGNMECHFGGPDPVGAVSGGTEEYPPSQDRSVLPSPALLPHSSRRSRSPQSPCRNWLDCLVCF